VFIYIYIYVYVCTYVCVGHIYVLIFECVVVGAGEKLRERGRKEEEDWKEKQRKTGT